MKTNSSAKKIIQILLAIKNESEMQDFLESILSPDEINSIVLRLEIIRLLKEKKMSQHAIAKKLGVGIATVTRGARELKLNRFKNI